MWKKKILAGKWDFQTALDYGIREVTAKKMGADLSKKNGTQEKPDDIPVNKVGEGRGQFCRKCVGNHAIDKSPAKNLPCGACGQKGHYPKSYTCPNNANHNPAQRGNGRGNGRNNGRNGRGNGRGGQPSDTKTKVVFRGATGSGGRHLAI